MKCANCYFNVPVGKGTNITKCKQPIEEMDVECLLRNLLLSQRTMVEMLKKASEDIDRGDEWRNK